MGAIHCHIRYGRSTIITEYFNFTFHVPITRYTGIIPGTPYEIQKRVLRLVSAHRLINITLLTLVQASYTVVPRGVADLSSMRTHTQYCARSEYYTQLAKMSFDEIFDLAAGWSVFCLFVITLLII